MNTETGAQAPAASGRRDIVVVGASAGGVEALSDLIGGLPGDLPAALFVVLHLMPSGTSALPRILARRTSLQVAAAADGEPIERGHVYVAPPDHHMLIEDGHVRLGQGPRENGHRPALDPLFRSAAGVYGRRVVGAVLSGALHDGTEGLQAIAQAGGATLAQEPADALYSSMPESAIRRDSPDWVGPISAMPAAICAALAGQVGTEVA